MVMLGHGGHVGCSPTGPQHQSKENKVKRQQKVAGLPVSMILALTPIMAAAEALPTIESTCPGGIGYGTKSAEVMLTIHMDTQCPYEINLYTPEDPVGPPLIEVPASTYKQRVYTIRVPADSFVQVRGTGTTPGTGGGVHLITLQVDPVPPTPEDGKNK